VRPIPIISGKFYSCMASLVNSVGSLVVETAEAAEARKVRSLAGSSSVLIIEDKKKPSAPDQMLDPRTRGSSPLAKSASRGSAAAAAASEQNRSQVSVGNGTSDPRTYG
jgi:hypothetical protein